MTAQSLLTASHFIIFIGAFLAALGALGKFYYGAKVEKQRTEAPSRIEENKQTSSALIITMDQKGGENTVNIYGQVNPANEIGQPIFDVNGHFGRNILHPDLFELRADSSYSFSARIPDNAKLQVRLARIGDDKTPLWGMSTGSITNWYYDRYKMGEQRYTLEEPRGDLRIYFWKQGTAQLSVYLGDAVVMSKSIHWR